MAKAKKQYRCSECAALSPKWQGRCPECGSWNTLEETVVEPEPASSPRYRSWAASGQEGAVDLSEVSAAETPRRSSGVAELDRVLGGGLVDGAVTLLGGDPGIGKSTLLLQVAAALAQRGESVAYVSGEESPEQVALRAARLNLEPQGVKLMSEISLQRILAELSRLNPRFAVIDSIQTVYSEDLSSAPGSAAQVRECASHLTRLAKQRGMTVFLIGHVTKDGFIAGPRVLEHMVDTVLYFEGDSHTNYRMIRAMKNRFGAANELGVFGMVDTGLVSVKNPSLIFLSSYKDDVAGSAVLVAQEGTRPLLVEVQALVDANKMGNPKRISVGLDQNRLAMLLAVLSRHVGLATYDQDVFVNAVGGVRIGEPAADLAVLLAILSSFSDKPLPAKTVVFGEIGLLGEVRPVARGQVRLKEAEKLGFRRAIIPKGNEPKKGREFEKIEVFGVDNLSEAVELARSLP